MQGCVRVLTLVGLLGISATVRGQAPMPANEGEPVLGLPVPAASPLPLTARPGQLPVPPSLANLDPPTAPAAAPQVDKTAPKADAPTQPQPPQQPGNEQAPSPQPMPADEKNQQKNGTPTAGTGSLTAAISDLPAVGLSPVGHGPCPTLGWIVRPPAPAVVDCRSGAWQQVWVPPVTDVPPPVTPKETVRVGCPWQRCHKPPIPLWVCPRCSSSWFHGCGHKKSCPIEPACAP